MTYLGYFSNGYVKLDEGVSLPEGTPVKVEVLHEGPFSEGNALDVARDANGKDTDDPEGDELVALLLRYAGKGKGLPSDLSANHDHYIHGKPLE